MLGRVTGLGGEDFVRGVSRSEAVLSQAQGKGPLRAVGLPGSKPSGLLSGKGQRPPQNPADVQAAPRVEPGHRLALWVLGGAWMPDASQDWVAVESGCLWSSDWPRWAQ